MREKAALKGEKTHCAKYPNVDTCPRKQYRSNHGMMQQVTRALFFLQYDSSHESRRSHPLVFLCLSSLPPPQLGSYFRISEAKVVHSSSSSLWSRLSQLQISRKIRSEQGRRTRGVITPRSSFIVSQRHNAKSLEHQTSET